MVGRVIKSQECLKIIDKAHRREGTINYGPTQSGRSIMKAGRLQKIKNVLKK